MTEALHFASASQALDELDRLARAIATTQAIAILEGATAG
jgi:hypothetical protein